jgi:flavin-dependent dehydrogenase
MKKADIAIIGGGPAGAIAALTLARNGADVILIEQSDGSNFVVGESLPPAARPILASLGLLERMKDGGHKTAYANRSVWGTDEVVTSDFIFNPLGCGWHLDRRAFNLMLISAAAEAGVRVLKSTCVTGAARTRDGWSLKLRINGEPDELLVGFISDCTGRKAAFAQKQGARRLHYDKLIAVVTLSEAKVQGDNDATTLIEAVAGGWWYTALLPSGQRITIYHTDRDLVDATRIRNAGEWSKLLGRTEYVREEHKRFNYQLLSGPRMVSAGSSRLNRVVGDRWLAAGDAAAAFDPLSSQGIMTALDSGSQAADAILANLKGNSSALQRYEANVKKMYAGYLWKRAMYYAQEKRWSTSTFWLRRQASYSTRAPVFAQARNAARHT